jgi:hypothetical protein
MRFFVLMITAGFICSAAEAAQLTVSPAACDQLVNYIEPAGVEYQPGVDANGNAVAPADIGNRRPIKPPTHIVIPITDYLASRLTGTQTNATGGNVLQPTANIGTVELTNGQVTFNGQPIGDDVDGDLGALCRKLRQQ